MQFERNYTLTMFSHCYTPCPPLAAVITSPEAPNFCADDFHRVFHSEKLVCDRPPLPPPPPLAHIKKCHHVSELSSSLKFKSSSFKYTSFSSSHCALAAQLPVLSHIQACCFRALLRNRVHRLSRDIHRTYGGETHTHTHTHTYIDNLGEQVICIHRTA